MYSLVYTGFEIRAKLACQHYRIILTNCTSSLLGCQIPGDLLPAPFPARSSALDAASSRLRALSSSGVAACAGLWALMLTRRRFAVGTGLQQLGLSLARFICSGSDSKLTSCGNPFRYWSYLYIFVGSCLTMLSYLMIIQASFHSALII